MAGTTSECTLIGYLSRHDRSVLPTWDVQLCSLFVWSDDQTCSVKMAKNWPCFCFIPKKGSKNLSQYPIKPTEQASSITHCLQYRFKVHVEQCSTCTSVQWSQRTTIINVIIYEDSLLGDRGKFSFPRMHMAYSSYAPCNSSVLAAFFSLLLFWISVWWVALKSAD